MEAANTSQREGMGAPSNCPRAPGSTVRASRPEWRRGGSTTTTALDPLFLNMQQMQKLLISAPAYKSVAVITRELDIGALHLGTISTIWKPCCCTFLQFRKLTKRVFIEYSDWAPLLGFKVVIHTDRLAQSKARYAKHQCKSLCRTKARITRLRETPCSLHE